MFISLENRVGHLHKKKYIHPFFFLSDMNKFEIFKWFWICSGAASASLYNVKKGSQYFYEYLMRRRNCIENHEEGHKGNYNQCQLAEEKVNIGIVMAHIFLGPTLLLRAWYMTVYDGLLLQKEELIEPGQFCARSEYQAYIAQKKEIEEREKKQKKHPMFHESDWETYQWKKELKNPLIRMYFNYKI